MSTVSCSPLSLHVENAADAQVQPRRGNNVVNKSSKARPNKRQYGWGNLPAELINRILTLVTGAHVRDHTIFYIGLEAVSVVDAVLHRQTLTQMRLVSSGWNNAINSHPFWTEQYLKVIRPDVWYNPRSAGPGTLLQLVRRYTADICIPCRLFHPGNANVAKRGCVTITAKLGEIATCDNHYSAFCTNCLRPQFREDIRLFISTENDHDEHGCVRPQGELVCRYCREAAFNVGLQQELARCARGGRFHGIAALWRETISYQDYCYFGMGSAQKMAQLAVEEMSLRHHASWDARIADAQRLQALLFQFKICLFKNRSFMPIKSDIKLFEDLVARIWDDEYSEYDEGPDLKYLFTQWHKSMATGQYDEDECQLDTTRFQLCARYIYPFIRDRVTEACINEWTKERVYYGYWVMPSDEIAQLRDTEIRLHTPFHDIASRTRLPTQPVNTYQASPARLARYYSGRFRPPPVDYNVDSAESAFFLPPQGLLHLLDEQFAQVLRNRLEAPLREIVDGYRRNFDPEQAEAICDSLALRQILVLLGKPRVWSENRVTNRDLVDMVIRPSEDEDDETTILVATVPRKSPRIEAVNDDDDPAPVEFVVRDGWSSTTEHEDNDDVGDDDLEDDEYDVDDQPFSPAVDVEASLGKRKQSEEEDEMNGDPRVPLRPRLGSGQTSHSSSGETVNTNLVTPDDSPDMMASAIQLAVEDDPAMETVVPSVAITDANPTPTSPSSSLGKRKLDQDDDSVLEQEHPTRRRESRSASSSNKDGLVIRDEKKPEIEVELLETVDMDAPDSQKTLNGKTARSDESTTVSGHSSPAQNAPAPKQQPLAMDEDDYESEDSFDGESEYGSEELEYGMPHIPPPQVDLGPAAHDLILDTWWIARAPLRDCHCTICIRGKNEQATRDLLSVAWQQGILRIA